MSNSLHSDVRADAEGTPWRLMFLFQSLLTFLLLLLQHGQSSAAASPVRSLLVSHNSCLHILSAQTCFEHCCLFTSFPLSPLRRPVLMLNALYVWALWWNSFQRWDSKSVFAHKERRRRPRFRLHIRWVKHHFWEGFKHLATQISRMDQVTVKTTEVSVCVLTIWRLWAKKGGHCFCRGALESKARKPGCIVHWALPGRLVQSFCLHARWTLL